MWVDDGKIAADEQDWQDTFALRGLHQQSKHMTDWTDLMVLII